MTKYQWLLLAFTVSLTGCVVDDAPPVCSTNSCPQGLYCSAELTCEFDCITDEDCAGGCNAMGQCMAWEPVAQFAVSWDLTEGDTGSELAAACPGTTAMVVTQNVANQQQFIDLFDCVDGAGVTALVALESYDVWVSITDEAVATTYAKSFTQSGSLFSDNQLVPVDFTFPIDGGFFSFAWALEDSAQLPVSCADLNSGGVEIDVTLVGPNTLYADIFDCTNMIATTDKVPIGDYTLVVSVLDESDLSIADSEARHETIDYGNHLNDLGVFLFGGL